MAAEAPGPLGPDQRVVIVGAGIAGLRVAEALREAGFSGSIVLVGDEAHSPYDRPPLSKAVLDTPGHEHAIALSPAGALEALGVELRLGCVATRIDRARREVTFAGGEQLAYDRLVLATGSRVRTLPAFPPDASGVFYLRGLDDALALRAALAAKTTVAVIGGGVIGLEVAATARGLGCEVTVIEAADRLMGRAASPTISGYMRRRHEEAGVGLRLSTTATPLERSPSRGFVLRLSSGEMLEADIVVVGVGVIPNAELAAEAGLAIEKSAILVDGQGATSDPAIWAAGEVAAHFNDWFGRHDRQETWNHAAAHGAHVGRALVATTEPYRQLPSYWSDQFDINLMIEGEPSGEDDVVRGDPASGRFLVFHTSAGAVAGVSAVNSARELRAAKRLIGRPADPAALADSAVGLASLAAA